MTKETAFRWITHISKVHIKRYKSIEDAQFTLVPGLNIIIGKNSSGKSNLLNCLYSTYGRGLFTEKSIFKFTDVIFKDGLNIEYEWSKERKTKFLPGLKEQTSLRFKNYFYEDLKIDNKIIFESHPDKENQSEIVKPNIINEAVNNFYNVNAKLREKSVLFPILSKVEFNIPNSLGIYSGPVSLTYHKEDKSLDEFTGLIDVQLVLKLLPIFPKASPEEIQAKALKEFSFPEGLNDKLLKYTPIKKIRLGLNVNVAVDDKLIKIENLYIEYLINNSWITWSSLSDGTKRLFYLIHTIITNPNSIILVEEPELGVHPHQFFQIMDFLKEESHERQIIISTHSPQSLDVLAPDELENIVISKYDIKKGSIFSHLTNVQMKKAKTYMEKTDNLSNYWLNSDLEG